MMMTFMEIKCHQRSNVVNYVISLPYLVKRTAEKRMMMTFMEVKGHQRSNITYVPWLPYLVKRIADAS